MYSLIYSLLILFLKNSYSILYQFYSRMKWTISVLLFFVNLNQDIVYDLCLSANHYGVCNYCRHISEQKLGGGIHFSGG